MRKFEKRRVTRAVKVRLPHGYFGNISYTYTLCSVALCFELGVDEFIVVCVKDFQLSISSFDFLSLRESQV